MSLIASLATGFAAVVVLARVLGLGGKRIGSEPVKVGRDRQSWINQAGIDVTVAQFVGWSIGAGLVSFLIVFSLTGIVAISLPPAAALAALPRVYFARRRIKVRQEIVAAWPDALRSLVASLKAGMSLTRALQELANSGPGPLQAVFEDYPRRAAMFGVVPALESIRERLADPLSDRVIEIVRVAYERGGTSVPSILEDVAIATTTDLRVAEEIKSEALEQKINARAVFVLPWFVLVALTARPGEFRDFYSSSSGLMVILGAACLSGGGIWIVGRLSKEPIEDRVIGVVT